MKDKNEIIIFYLEKQQFALKLNGVDKILRSVEITLLPAAPEIVLGVVNVQGEIIPVIDTRKRFKYESRGADLNNYFIIGKIGDRRVALLVDEIGVIVSVDDTKVIDSKEILPAISFIEGAVKLEGDIVFIHDLEKCLSLEETKVLDQALEAMNKKSVNKVKSK